MSRSVTAKSATTEPGQHEDHRNAPGHVWSQSEKIFEQKFSFHQGIVTGRIVVAELAVFGSNYDRKLTLLLHR